MYQDLEKHRYQRGYLVWGFFFFFCMQVAGQSWKGSQETGIRPSEVPDKGGLILTCQEQDSLKRC